MIKDRGKVGKLNVELNKGCYISLFVSPKDATTVAGEVEKNRKTQ